MFNITEGKFTQFWYVLLIFLIFFILVDCGQPPYIRSDGTKDQISVSKGGKIKIDCWVYGTQPIKVKWFKNRKLLQVASHIKILANHSLVIKAAHLNFNHNDGGEYYCRATNRYGSFNGKAVIVNVRFLGDVFPAPKSTAIFYKESHLMKCVLPDGYPPPMFVEWRKDGIPLHNSSIHRNVRIIESHGINKLYIDSAEKANAGGYVCVARNTEGERVSHVATVRVIAKGPPKVVINPSPVNAHLGSKAELKCKDISADRGNQLTPTRTWSKMNGVMPLSRRFKKSDNGILTILEVMKSDEGKYKCTATHGGMEYTAFGLLKVYDPPSFVIVPTDQSVPRHATASFSCKVENGIAPYVYWRHKDVTYKRSIACKRICIKDTNELVIKEIMPYDGGIVQCIINDNGLTINAVATLTVSHTPSSIPKISVTPLNVTVIEGRKHTISCVGIGDGSIKFEWTSAANNQKIGNTDGKTVIAFPNGSNLTFDFVKPTDRGVYRCKVIGISGGTNSQTSALQVVLGAPAKVSILKAKKEGQRKVRLTWQKPLVEYTLPITNYVIIARNIENGKENVDESVGADTVSKMIRRLQQSAVYVFSIAAVNKAGRGEFVNSSIIDMSVDLKKPAVSSIKLLAGKVTFNSVEVTWNSVGSQQFMRHVVYIQQLGNVNVIRKKEIYNTTNQYAIIKNLKSGMIYYLWLEILNFRTKVAISPSIQVTTLLKITSVSVEKIDSENLMVLWSHPLGLNLIAEDVTGYEVSCSHDDGSLFFTARVNKRGTRYLLSGLAGQENYYISISLQGETGVIGRSLEYRVKLDSMNVGEVIGAPSDSSLTVDKSSDKNSLSDMLRQPWFIVTAAILIWLLLMVMVICIVKACKRRNKRQYEREMEINKGLLRTRGEYSNNTLQNSVTWKKDGHVEVQIDRRKSKVNNCCRGRKFSADDDFPNKVDIKVPSTYRRQESVESRSRQPYDMFKESNNILAKKKGLLVDQQLNNEINRNNQQYVNGEEYRRKLLRRPSQEPGGLSSSSLQRRDPRFKSGSVERRHAEIVRTVGNKSFHNAKPDNDLNSNPGASWKHTPKTSPKVAKQPGEDTLRRQANYKPLPNLELMHWSNMPSNSSQIGSVTGDRRFSPPSSPKVLEVLVKNDLNNKSAPTLSPDGESSHSTSTPDQKRHRKTSNSSSMVSSELYQSEMDPSAYSDTASERKRKKEKAIPPPISLDGLTSDILLQWAESVTNSSPSSSESSSPTRLSGLSSDGSIYSDQHFAKAVAAVAECGGFNFGNETSTPNIYAPHIPMSNYLGGLDKLPSDMYPTPLTHRSVNNKSSIDKNLLRYGTGFQDVDSVSTSTKPLTKSNLKQHNSSLDRDKKQSTKLLTVSNLREHDNSLDRTPKNIQRSLPVDNCRERDPDPEANPFTMPEAALSFTSALEPHESMNSKDSPNSSNKDDSQAKNTSTSERKAK